jgi:hypothetical protein
MVVLFQTGTQLDMVVYVVVEVGTKFFVSKCDQTRHLALRCTSTLYYVVEVNALSALVAESISTC